MREQVRLQMQFRDAVEATMSAVSDHATQLHKINTANGFWIASILRRWWQTFRDWQIEQAAAAQLYSMSDYELRDIGLKRSEIDAAVKGPLAHPPRPRNLP
jgi:uncharacterized protein YjiS (DUF1127 family)